MEPSNAAGTGASGAGSRAAGGTSGVLTGAGCTLDAATGITLCTKINACAGVVIDSDLFPNCGFRPTTGSLQIECLCVDSLCPMGTPKDCAQVRALLASASQLAVCAQVSENKCVRIKTTNSSDPNGTKSNCDRDCAIACAGVLDCPKLCGC